MGWWVVAGGAILQLMSSGLVSQAFGAYFVHLQQEFGWSRTVLSGAFSTFQAAGGMIGPVQGPLVDRLGTRKCAAMGAVLVGSGLIAFSFIHSMAALYGAFVVLAIGGAFAGWVTLNVAAANWFRRKRTTAIGIVSAGGTMGGLMVPAVAWSINTYGWRPTAFGCGVVALAVGLPLASLVRHRPEDHGLAPDGDPPNSPAARASARADASSADFTALEAMRTPAFWLIGLGHASAVLLVSAVSVHLIAHLVGRLQLSIQLASGMLAVMTVFTILGQVVGGLLGDRMEKRSLAAVGMGGHVLGMLALAFATSLVWVVAFTVLHGMAWGMRGPLMSAIRADYFGRRYLGTVLGFSAPVMMLGTVGGPLLAGFLADVTGDYRLGFTILGGIAGLGSLCFLAARKPKPRRTAARRTGLATRVS